MIDEIKSYLTSLGRLPQWFENDLYFTKSVHHGIRVVCLLMHNTVPFHLVNAYFCEKVYFVYGNEYEYDFLIDSKIKGKYYDISSGKFIKPDEFAIDHLKDGYIFSCSIEDGAVIGCQFTTAPDIRIVVAGPVNADDTILFGAYAINPDGSDSDVEVTVDHGTLETVVDELYALDTIDIPSNVHQVTISVRGTNCFGEARQNRLLCIKRLGVRETNPIPPDYLDIPEGHYNQTICDLQALVYRFAYDTICGQLFASNNVYHIKRCGETPDEYIQLNIPEPNILYAQVDVPYLNAAAIQMPPNADPYLLLDFVKSCSTRGSYDIRQTFDKMDRGIRREIRYASVFNMSATPKFLSGFGDRLGRFNKDYSEPLGYIRPLPLRDQEFSIFNLQNIQHFGVSEDFRCQTTTYTVYGATEFVFWVFTDDTYPGSICEANEFSIGYSAKSLITDPGVKDLSLYDCTTVPYGSDPNKLVTPDFIHSSGAKAYKIVRATAAIQRFALLQTYQCNIQYALLDVHFENAVTRFDIVYSDTLYYAFSILETTRSTSSDFTLYANSDIDGDVTVGDTLSPGTHLITVRATANEGNPFPDYTDTKSVTVLPFELTVTHDDMITILSPLLIDARFGTSLSDTAVYVTTVTSDIQGVVDLSDNTVDSLIAGIHTLTWTYLFNGIEYQASTVLTVSSVLPPPTEVIPFFQNVVYITSSNSCYGVDDMGFGGTPIPVQIWNRVNYAVSQNKRVVNYYNPSKIAITKLNEGVLEYLSYDAINFTLVWSPVLDADSAFLLDQDISNGFNIRLESSSEYIQGDGTINPFPYNLRIWDYSPALSTPPCTTPPVTYLETYTPYKFRVDGTQDTYFNKVGNALSSTAEYFYFTPSLSSLSGTPEPIPVNTIMFLTDGIEVYGSNNTNDDGKWRPVDGPSVYKSESLINRFLSGLIIYGTPIEIYNINKNRRIKNETTFHSFLDNHAELVLIPEL